MNTGPITKADFYTQTPLGIAQNLQWCLDQAEDAPGVVDIIREDTMGLVEALKASQQGKPQEEAITTAHSITAKSSNGRMGKQLDEIPDPETQDRVLECINKIGALARRVISLKNLPPPERDPLYPAWMEEMTHRDSIGRKLLVAIGSRPAGQVFSAKELEGMIGSEDNNSNTVRMTLGTISAKSRGTDFELTVHKEGREVRFFINPTQKSQMSQQEIAKAIWLRRVAPREDTVEKKLALFLLQNTDTDLTVEQIAEETGAPLSAIYSMMTRAIERGTGTDLELQRRKNVDNRTNPPTNTTIYRLITRNIASAT